MDNKMGPNQYVDGYLTICCVSCQICKKLHPLSGDSFIALDGAVSLGATAIHISSRKSEQENKIVLCYDRECLMKFFDGLKNKANKNV